MWLSDKTQRHEKGVAMEKLRSWLIRKSGNRFEVMDRVLCFIGWHDWIIIPPDSNTIFGKDDHVCWLCHKQRDVR